MDDFFAELDAEIATALDKSKRKQKAADLKKTSNNRFISQEARKKAEAEYLELRALIEAESWFPVCTIALFTEQQCDGCASVHRVFLQYMEKQTKRDKPNSHRSVRVSFPNPDLPRETMIQSHRTHMCAHCCDDHGFALDFAEVLSVSTSALTISSTYVQDDINGPSEAS